MAHVPPELQAHKEWLGQIQQVGLVVSPNVLIRHGIFIERQKSVEKVLAKINLMINSKVKKVPRDLQDNPAILPVLKDIGKFRSEFAKAVQTYQDRTNKATKHLNAVMLELESA